MSRQRFLRLFTLSILICGLCSHAAWAQSKKDIAKANELLDQGNQAFAQKRYHDAIDKYQQAILLVPKNPDAHFRKAYAHYNQNEYDSAKYEFQLALDQSYKKPVDIYSIRWHLFYDLKDYDAALADLKNGVAIEPRNLDFLSGAGDVYTAKKQFKDALDAYQKGLALSPKSGDLYCNIARVQQILGDTAAQRTAADEAVKNGTRMSGEAFYLLADAARKQKDLPAAIDAYQRAISSSPDNYDAYKSLADLFRGQARFQDAIEVLKKARLQFRTDGSILNDLARYDSLVGRPEDALKDALAGISLQPNQYAGYTNLCRAYNEVQKFQDAITACNRALTLKPGDGETDFYLGNAYLQLNKASEADRYYRFAVTGLTDYTTKNPDYADGWYLLGGALFNNNQPDKSIEAYLKCLAISPNFAKARFNLGFIYRVKKNKAGATEQYNKLVKLDAALAAKLKAEIDKM